jgi:flavin reductase (DIM6/NTAB) family NADH-FMN oxidoreductase RutF
MTMSWLTMMEFEPPLVGCIVSNRNYSFNLLKTTKECVIALPLAKLARKVVKVGNCSGRDEDKFRTIGLTPLPAAFVRAPLIRECYANLECKVVNTSLVSRYNFFVLEVVKAWVQRTREPLRTIHHRGKGLFMLAGNTVRLPSKMK